MIGRNRNPSRADIVHNFTICGDTLLWRFIHPRQRGINLPEFTADTLAFLLDIRRYGDIASFLLVNVEGWLSVHDLSCPYKFYVATLDDPLP